ncbi:ABC transporter substrate-binding protein [Paenibacillus bovis]|nr:ABC transporter substrate-binding protein [Paenibacillus bovis]
MAEDYMRLRQAFTDQQEQQWFRVTMDELAGALCCTSRNARLILSRLAEAAWITFQPGRGRGNRSALLFHRSAAEVLLEEARERVIAGDVQAAFDWVYTYEKVANVRNDFLPWLTAYFGYSAAGDDTEQIIETLRLPIYRPIVCLDPANAVFAFDTELVDQLYSRLTGYDADSGRVTAGIAHAWECYQEGTVWTFYLLKHINFHSGQELTAHDVAASLERLRSHPYAHSWLVGQVDTIRVLNRYTVQIILDRPNRYLDLYMSHSGASILPAGTWPDTGLPIGSGAYRIIRLQHGQCVLERFPGYYDRGAMIDRIEIIIVPEHEAEYAIGPAPGTLTVVTGEIAIDPPADLLRQHHVTGVSMLSLNRRTMGPLQNHWLRQALVQGIDRQRMICELGETRISAARGLHVTQGREGSLTGESPYEFRVHEDTLYQPEQAEKALCMSGYKGIMLKMYTFPRHERDAYWLQTQYRKLGIEIAIHVVSWAELNHPMIREHADLILFEAVLAGGLLPQLEYLQSDHSLIRSRLPEKTAEHIDQIIAQMLCSDTAAFTDKRPRERNQQQISAWQQVETVLADSHSIVPLVERSATLLHHPGLRGVRINARGWTRFQDLWFSEMP